MPRQKQSVIAAGLQRLQGFLAGEVMPVAGARPLVNWLRMAGRFVHLVVAGFLQNRCPARAAGLSYATLLALVPLLAVVLSVSKNFLHDRSAELVPRLLDKMVAMVAPQLEYMPLPEEVAGPPAPGQAVVSSRARQQAVQNIQAFIDNIHAGTLGVVGSVFLIFVAMRLLMTVERAFNDIWGVPKGRSLWRKVVYYWTTITLGPLLLLVAISVTGTVEFSTVFGRLRFAPAFQKLLLHLAPFVVLWVGFSLMYALMPNTYVRPRAAIVGGVVGGTLWQLNNLLSTMYVSRVVTYSKIYGALGIIPVFLLGLYFSWLIVLLGAQVAFAAQNVRWYMRQRGGEGMDEEGRELIACRIVLWASHHFLRGNRPPTAEELADRLGAPLQLLNQLVHRLIEGGVLCKVSEESGLQPARPPDSITVADVLHVVRTHAGRCGEPPAPKSAEQVEQLLCELYAAERRSPANANFAELAARLEARTA